MSPSDRDSRRCGTKVGKGGLSRHGYSIEIIIDDSDDSSDGVIDSSTDDDDSDDDDNRNDVLRDKPTKMCGSLAGKEKEEDGSDFWEPGKEIRVRFLDGLSATHKLVEKCAKTWEEYANINFRFVTKGPAEIRISFKGQGSYSRVGIRCLKVKDQDSPTMNLEIDKDHANLKRVVLHEFGHVLGLLHEHSSPEAGIPWNKEAVYKYYRSLGWGREWVDANVLKCEGVNVEGFDKDSIMMYPVDAKLTIGGYSVPWNKNLSKMDKEAIRMIYPFDGDQRSERRQQKSSSISGDNLSKAIKLIQKICDESENRSTAYSDGSQGYKDSVRHYIDSSSEVASIAVQPGNEQDLSKIIKCIAKYRVPFAVKGGGHSMVPGFSSTTGIQISMARFSKVIYDSSKETVDVGAGCLWDEVYNELTPRKRNAVGGAARQGVGVAGWLLGGGYSLKSNQYGLGIDNIEAFRVVLPDGTICTATAKSNKYGDLYQGLRGGGNNFGIVTQFTLKTHKHRTGYGAQLKIPGNKEKEAKKAIMDFVDNEKRPEAALVAAFRHSRLPGQSKIQYDISAFCVFDAKKPSKNVPFRKFAKLVGSDFQSSSNPAGWKRQGQVYDIPTDTGPAPVTDIFREMSPDELNGITSSLYEIDAPPPYEEIDSTPSGVRYAAPSAKNKSTRVKGMANLGELNMRGRFGCIMISEYTAAVVDAIAAEAKKVAESLSKKNGRMVVIDVWPFLETIFEYSPPGAAWPHKPKEPFGPCLAYFQWYDEKDDDFWVGTMKSSLRRIRRVALSEGATVDSPAYYSNTSLESVPVKQIYRENFKWLRKLRKKYDPDDVMSLTGGFRIPLSK